MAITYPLVLPGAPSTRRLRVGMENAIGVAASPYTGSENVYEWPFERFTLAGSLPGGMNRDDAEPWLAALAALRGRLGTFYAGDVNARAPRGAAKAYVNLLRYSEFFDDPAWGKGGTPSAPVVTANAVNDPNGNLRADQIVFPATGAGQQSIIAQTLPGLNSLSGRSACGSIYLRAAAPTSIVLWLSDGLVQAVNLNCAVTTNWQRFSVALSNFTPTVLAHLRISNDDSSPAKTIFAWGAQVEFGAAPAAYEGANIWRGACLLGAHAAGLKTLATQGWPANVAGVLLAGDYIMLVYGTTLRLHKLLRDVNTDGAGNATLEIFPRLRAASADSQPIFYHDCRGTFRLTDNRREWDLDEALKYGISFSAAEAL